MIVFETLKPLGIAGLCVLALGAAVSFASRPIARRFGLKTHIGLQLAGLALAVTGYFMVMA